MAYYALLNENNVVVEVITGRDDGETINGISDWESYYGRQRNMVCKRTYFDGEQRGNFAGIGFVYDEKLDAFIPPRPFPSWQLNTSSFAWEAPIAHPSTGERYEWFEPNREWIKVTV